MEKKLTAGKNKAPYIY